MEGPCPTAIDMLWWYGYSVAHWDGDELVVESTNYRDGGWLGYNGSPLTDEARIIERFRRPTYGSLEIDVTVDDPKAYTEPFTVRVDQRLLPDNDLIEWVARMSSRHSTSIDKPGAGGRAGRPTRENKPMTAWGRLRRAALILLVVPISAAAHHSFRAQYDSEIVVEVTGTITEVAWTNPHARFHVAAENESGETVTWDFELGSPSALFRRPGWSISTLQVGMMVTVVAYRARNAPNVANTVRITFDDGREVITLGTVPRD